MDVTLTQEEVAALELLAQHCELGDDLRTTLHLTITAMLDAMERPKEQNGTPRSPSPVRD